jgi:accessory gene regulator B
MFTNTVIKITDHMEKNNLFASEDREIYLFGVQQGLIILLNVLTVAVVGLVFGVFWSMVMFTVAFIPLRSFAGGCHASTPIRCYIVSTVMIAIMAFVFWYASFVTLPVMALLLATGIAIIILAPIGTANKPLDSVEKKVYKKKTAIICSIEVLAALFFFHLGIHFISTGILLALLMVLALMLLEIFTGRRKG